MGIYLCITMQFLDLPKFQKMFKQRILIKNLIELLSTRIFITQLQPILGGNGEGGNHIFWVSQMVLILLYDRLPILQSDTDTDQN